MTMTPFRRHVALAVDGGGIKGLIVAQALERLEKELGGKPLIDHPQIQVLAGTSTGAIITAGLAVGMHAREIAEMYVTIGKELFKPLLPPYFPRPLQQLYRVLLSISRTSVYSAEGLINVYKRLVGEKTLGELHEELRRRRGPDKALIVTTVDVKNRRTKFLKSYDPKDGDWKLYEAVLASSAAPTYLPVYKRIEGLTDVRYYADGGIGNYNNPGYVAAREAVHWKHAKPGDVTVLSFGVGWLAPVNFEATFGRPSEWRAIDWAKNGVALLIGDAARGQSLNVIEGYVSLGMDFRRFQIGLLKDIPIDSSDPANLAELRRLGDELGERLIKNQHALEDAQYDPEGLLIMLDRYRDSLKRVEESEYSVHTN
ncbi:MAG: patatin-like phospholipase family protein [Anaerolineae bacterium]|nr:patatin-like phospholipase family protein [Anaerolineae bacterium]